MPRRFVLWLVSLIALGNWGLAQEPTETARPRLDSTRFGNDVPPRDEHVIYVPYTKLRDVFEKQGASVLLPYAQFLQLWSGMPGPAIPLPIKPPLAGLISRADYVGKVEGDQARIEATLTLEVLGEEWARLPVSFGDAAVGAVRGDQEPVLLRGLGDGNYELLLKGRGTRRVAFELMARVLPVADGKGITIQCPPVGLSSLELEVDQSDISVQVNPRRIAQIRSEKNRTRIQATLGATDRFSVTWQPKAGVADEQAGLASVSDIFEIDVGDGIIHTHAVFDYQILRGSLDSLVIGLPADQRLLDVQATGMRDWATEADAESAGRQRLVVRLHAPTRDRVRLELHTESAIPEQSFPVASFHAIGVARESGVIAVRSAEDVGLEYVTHSGVSRVDAPDVPEPLRKPRSTFYKFFSPNFQLAASAVTLEPRVVVESFLTITLEKARLSLRGEFKFDVTRAGVFAVPLRLPPEFHVDEVQCDLMDRHETTTAAEGQILTVYLGRKVLGTLKLTVVASQPRVAQSGELTLPLLEPMGISREQGLIAVIAPDSIEVNSDPAKLEGARPATPAELATRGFQPQSVKGSTLAAAFAFTSRPVQIGLATRERPRRVLAQVFTVASVKEDLITVNTDIRYDIQYAGTDTFRLAVPAVFADRVQISGEGIKEKRKAEEPESDGTIIWTVVLHSEAIGGRTLNLSYDAHISVPDK